MFLNNLFAWINNWSKVIIQTPWVGAYGNIAEDMYYGLLKARREGKRVLFLFPHDLFWKFRFSKVGINRELLKLESPYRYGSHESWISFLGGWILTFVYCLLKIYVVGMRVFLGKKVHGDYSVPNLGKSGLWCHEDTKEFSYEKVASFNWREQHEEYLPIRMPEESFQRALLLRKEMGLPEGAWYVCLHVREEGYYKSEGPLKRIRNASIHNYVEAINAITDRGGWVVRIGDPTMTPLPPMEHVLDYPHTRFKSDLMDIYLQQECRFFIGAGSGPFMVNCLFQKPSVMPNMYDVLVECPVRRGDIGILKHLYSKSKTRFLSLTERLVDLKDIQFLVYSSAEYQMHENTPEEIRDLVVEYLQYLEAPAEHERSALQLEWDRRRRSDGQRFFETALFNEGSEDDLVMRYHYASHIDGFVGTIGKKYLGANWQTSVMNGGGPESH